MKLSRAERLAALNDAHNPLFDLSAFETATEPSKDFIATATTPAKDCIAATQHPQDGSCFGGLSASSSEVPHTLFELLRTPPPAGDPQAISRAGEILGKQALTLINTAKLIFHHDLLSLVNKQANAQSGGLVHAGTGFGKSGFAICMIAIHLAKGELVYWATPTLELVDQAVADVKALTHIDPSKIMIATGSVAPGKRADLYKSASLVIGTPETLRNDLQGGRIPIDRFGLLIADEGDLASGEHAYAVVANLIKTLRAKFIWMSATPGDNRRDIEKRQSKLATPVYAHVADRKKDLQFHNWSVELASDQREALQHLEQAALRFVDETVKLVPYNEFARRLLVKTSENGPGERMPSLSELQELLVDLRANIRDLNGAARMAISNVTALNEVCYLRETLACVGKAAFLSHALTRSREKKLFGNSKRYLDLVYDDQAVRNAVAQMCYSIPLDREGWAKLSASVDHTLRANHASRNDKLRRNSAYQHYAETFAQLEYVDHPLTAQLTKVAVNRFSSDSAFMTYILVGLTFQANFLERVLVRELGPLNVGVRSITGSESMSSERRRQNMQDVRDGKASAVVATRVLERGVHLPSASIFFADTRELVEPRRFAQALGRAGRKDWQQLDGAGSPQRAEVHFFYTAGTASESCLNIGRARYDRMTRDYSALPLT